MNNQNDNQEDERIQLPTNAHFTPLGHDDGNFYFRIHATNQVINLRAERHRVCYLLILAPLKFWSRIFPSKDSIGRQDWETAFCRAADSLIGSCFKAGIYEPEGEVIYAD